MYMMYVCILSISAGYDMGKFHAAAGSARIPYYTPDGHFVGPLPQTILYLINPTIWSVVHVCMIHVFRKGFCMKLIR